MSKNKIVKEIGLFPILSEQYRIAFPTGQIILKHGEHKGANRGFGVVHILAEHKADLTRFGLSHDETGVTLYVEMILQSGAKIFSEFSDIRGNHRPMIVYSRIGTVILERKEIEGKSVYSVVTAFGRTSPRGTQIGTMPQKDKSTQ